MRKKKRVMIASVLGIAALFLAARLSLPSIILRAVNRKLGALEDYQGRVDKIGLSLWRGVCRIDGVRIEKRGSKLSVPLLSIERIAFSIDLAALMGRRIVSNIAIMSPRLNFVKGPAGKNFPEKPSEAEEANFAAEPNESFAKTLKGLLPIEINRLEINDGQIHYLDVESVPKVDVALTNVRVKARNLRNRPVPGDLLPADVQIKAKAFETGDLSIALRANPLKESPTFELKQTLSGVEVTKLNDLMDAYANVRAKKGVFGLYVEAAGKNGKFVGYAKPILNDLILDKKAGGNAGKQVWAAVASAIKWIFSNKDKKQVATNIPIEGSFSNMRVGLWMAVGGILKNAYIKALTPTLEGIGLKDVNAVKP